MQRRPQPKELWVGAPVQSMQFLSDSIPKVCGKGPVISQTGVQITNNRPDLLEPGRLLYHINKPVTRIHQSVLPETSKAPPRLDVNWSIGGGLFHPSSIRFPLIITLSILELRA